MASSQNQRYQERLAARQRGAGTHKVSTTGFTIGIPGIRPPAPPPPPPPAQSQPLAPLRSGRSAATAAAANHAPQTVLPPSPRAQATAAVSEADKGPKVVGTPLAPRRSGRSAAARGQTATLGDATNTAAAAAATTTAAPSSLRKEVTTGAARRSSAQRPRATSQKPVEATPIITSSSQPSSDLETPTHISTRSRSSTRSAAVASATPVPRGKRTRQPSPDKFLTTPEIAVLREGGKGARALAEDEEFIQKGKKRKVTREEEPVEEPVVEEVPAVEEEEEDVIPTPQPQQRKQKNKREGKKMPPPRITREEEEEAAEAERQAIAAAAKEVDESIIEPEPEPDEAPDEDEEEEFEDGEEDQEAEIEEESDEDDNGDEAVPSPPPTRVRKRPKSSTSKARTRAQASDADEEALRRRRQDAIPITVYRLSKAAGQTLPPGSQRGGVNAADSISQVFMEVIDKFYSKLDKSSEKQAVEAFKEELALRLMELSDALETNITFNARVRQAQRKKAELQTQLLELRRKRAGVAVQMDDVRIKHEVATRASNNRQTVTTTFEGIAGVIERGRARHTTAAAAAEADDEEIGMDGLEALAMKVAPAVAGGGEDGTGLLSRVVEFNRFLERAEAQLRASNDKARKN